ncbi:restriction endonuclease [Bradyrhizobium sp. HKCCYLS2038]|uniref:restriction endonuclease n=1 Tax=unclassified Bradyrhizobium TaxID=2631580 RepID=UPI003EB8DF61
MPAIASGVIAAILAAADAGSTAQKGAALERVVTDTLCLLDGIGVLFTNAVDVDNSCEIDILLYNQRHPAGLPFLPDNILIECKNWSSPVNTATLRSFTSKLRQFKLDFGVVVASSGITGDQSDRTAGHAHLRREFDQIGLKTIIITRLELEGLASSEDLSLLLRRKFGAFIMGLPGF